MSDDRQHLKNLIRRGSVRYLKRRVPKAYQEIEPRKVIWKSLEARSEAAAVNEGGRVWLRILAKWRELKAYPKETSLAVPPMAGDRRWT